jgi:hypothetical protein
MIMEKSSPQNSSMPFVLLLGHVIVLVLAGTSFTVITAMRNGQFQCEYFRFASQSGWGSLYESPYSLAVVLAYLGAYGTGLAAYLLAWRRHSSILVAAVIVLCALGFASFAFELTHWFVDHQRSCIISMPAALMLLAAAASIQQYRLRSIRPT